MTTTSEALYELHIDAFLEGVAEDPPKVEEFGLTKEQGHECRRRVWEAKGWAFDTPLANIA